MSIIETQKIQTGYKQTELGMIPDDWSVKMLPDVLDYIHGKAHERFIVENGKYEVVNSKFISTDGVVKKFSNENFCSAKKGDVLTVLSDLPNGKALAKCFYVQVDNKYAVNQRVCIWRSRSVDQKYLYYILNRNKYFLGLNDGVSQTHVLNHHILKCPLIIPSNKKEQTAIATVLFDTDALIEKLEKLIEKKKNIKQGAMKELLTGKKRLPGFNGEWETKKLVDFLDYEQPTDYLVTDTEYNYNNQTPVLTAGKTFILGYTNEESGIFTKLPVIIFDDFTTAIKYVDFSFKAKSSAMKMLVPKNKDVNMRFMYEIMVQIKYPLGDHKRHWICEYRYLDVNIPTSAEEQNAIASVLSEMDTEIEKLELQLVKYQNIKQGMMQQLLTGKIRIYGNK